MPAFTPPATSVAITAAEGPAVQASRNGETIRTQAATALTNNRAYLALAAPVAADNVLQIRALTRQNNALIRMLLGQLDGTN